MRTRLLLAPLFVGVLALVAPVLVALAAQTPPKPSLIPNVTVARVLHRYPHDTSAFTEGLLVHDGSLYESTGREGQSFIRRVDLATGRTLARAAVPTGLFGEGIVAWRSNLYSVTWHGGQGFAWTLPGLKRTGGFRYDGEGWAMTADARELILSDGTPVLRFLDPASKRVVRRLTVTWGGKPVRQINELEWVNGEILANIWMTPLIARIDPVSGRVTGWIDLTPLVTEVNLADRDSVANGIAWDARGRHLYVTGKNWPTLYEIALPAK